MYLQCFISDGTRCTIIITVIVLVLGWQLIQSLPLIKLLVGQKKIVTVKVVPIKEYMFNCAFPFLILSISIFIVISRFGLVSALLSVWRNVMNDVSQFVIVCLA